MKRSRLFARRTGKVLAISRAAMALVFLLALVIDPTAQSRSSDGIYLVLVLYIAGSIGMIVIAWRSWWWEFRLAPVVHVVDTVAFVAAVYLSESGAADFSSPFMSLTAFLLISATLRWGWQAVAWTAMALVLLNLVVGLGMILTGGPVEPYRYGRRLLYLAVLSVMLVWLGGERRTSSRTPLPRTSGAPGARRLAIMTDVLAFARDALGARGAALAVPHGEEPWTEVLRDTDAGRLIDRIGPDLLEGKLGDHDRAALFNLRHRRRIQSRANYSPVVLPGLFRAPLAEHCGINEGLIITFDTAAGPGQLLVWGIDDMCTDDMPLLEDIALHLSTELDRENLAELEQAASSAALRDALARDLHDSVAQFLAGTQFRLEAVSRLVRDSQDPTDDINELRTALRREQGELRAMIQRLRLGEEGDRRTDLIEELKTLFAEMSQHWQIAVALEAFIRPLPVSIGLAHELRQLLREAIANAARHGQCRAVSVAVSPAASGLTLRITDDGIGFPEKTSGSRPRSISERVEALGGTLEICHDDHGVTLDISLPNRNA